MIKCTLINNETGEIINSDFTIEELQDKQRKREHAEKDKLTKEFKMLQQTICGNFVFFIFKNMDTLTKILNDNDIVKFIYVGTYVKGNGALMLDNNFTYINKKKLKQLIGTSDVTFNAFYKKLIDNELILNDNDIIYINLNYFYRGGEKTYKELVSHKLEDFTRIYIKATRELYLQSDTRKHKQLSIVYKLLPFINWRYNILCKNINEQDKERLEVLTVNDVMELLGYNKKNIGRFQKDFYNLKYNNYQVFASVQFTSEYGESLIVVNPLLLYRGNDKKELEYLIALFQVGENQNNKNKLHSNIDFKK